MYWIKKHLLQKSIYWKPPGRDGSGGYIWSFPEEIMSRWERSRRVVYDSKGSEVFSSVGVWLERDVAVGGYLMECSFEGFGVASLAKYTPDDMSASSKNGYGALQIIGVEREYSLSKRASVFYKATLQKHGLSKGNR